MHFSLSLSLSVPHIRKVGEERSVSRPKYKDGEGGREAISWLLK